MATETLMDYRGPYFQGFTKVKETWLLIDTRAAGGIESHVAELAEGLAKVGEAPRVIFMSDHGPHPLKERLSSADIPWEFAGGFGNLTSAAYARKPGTLHTHGYKAGVYGRAAGILAGIPVVSSFHAGERAPGRVGVYDTVDRWTSLFCSRVAVSKQIQARIPWGAVLIPNFVAIPETPMRGLVPDTVAFVGRMSHEKGADLFVKLAEKVPGPRYIAFGEGVERAACEAASVGYVSFPGAVTSMSDHWKDIGLLAITSRAEGLPLAALEAMSEGVPVAAFAVGGLPSLIEDGVDGYLAKPGDIGHLSDCVRAWRALSDQERLDMACRARAKIESHFSSAAGIASMRKVYATAGR